MNLTIGLSLFLLVLQSCEASPEGVQRKARLYFPRAVAAQTDNLMVVYTCTNLGEAAVNELAPIISAKVADVKESPAIVSGGWRTLAVGFQNQIVTINMTNKAERHQVVPANSFPVYAQKYSEKCSQSSQPAANAQPYRIGNGVSPPTVLSRVEPKYPDEARGQQCQGATVIEAVVWRDGIVHVMRVVRGTGCASLDEAAMQALRQWRFKPGIKDGIPVDVVMNIVITFMLR